MYFNFKQLFPTYLFVMMNYLYLNLLLMDLLNLLQIEWLNWLQIQFFNLLKI